MLGMCLSALLGSYDRGVGGGVGMSSALCQSVANKGLAHSVMPFNTCYIDTGLFGLYAIAEPQHIEELSKHMVGI